MSKTKVEFSKSNTMTAAGIGTTMYRAPEVHPDANPDGKGKVNWFKADVFSYSMTCAHLLSLRRPFGDMERLRELYKELMNGRRPELPREYPEDLVALLRECWNINPGLRPSFMEICRRLEMFRHTYMRGFSLVDEGLQEGQRDLERGFDFIKSIIFLKSSIPRLVVVESELEMELRDMEGMLPNQRGEHKHQAYNGQNWEPQMGSPSNGGDRQGYMFSPESASPESASSSPFHPTFSFPTFASIESLDEFLALKLRSVEKQSESRFVSKISSFMWKRIDSGLK